MRSSSQKERYELPSQVEYAACRRGLTPYASGGSQLYFSRITGASKLQWKAQEACRAASGFGGTTHIQVSDLLLVSELMQKVNGWETHYNSSTICIDDLLALWIHRKLGGLRSLRGGVARVQRAFRRRHFVSYDSMVRKTMD